MNPSTALATVVVDELLRVGAREAVLAPGSRNAPLSYALHAAEQAGRLRLHVRIDERTAGFLALGLAKASGRPVAVVTTSGTAAVNLHPAVVEAEYSQVPLVAVTADRPAEMHGTGANQTIDQVGLYGRSAAAAVQLAADRPGGAAAWRSALRRTLAAGARAPVHLNVALREPLVPVAAATWPGSLDDESATEPDRDPHAGTVDAPLAGGGRTVVVAGDSARADVRGIAQAAGWPLLAEPSSGHRAGPNALAAYRLYLDDVGHDIERVLVAGRPTLSRPVTRLLARGDVEVVRLRDDLRAPKVDRSGDETWLRCWLDADRAAVAAVADVLDGSPLSGPAVARAVAASVPPDGLLVAGSSSPVRDLDLANPWDHQPPLVLANRGASGIDGTVSTAVGAALAHGRPAVALVGDLTFLHDATGLVIGPAEPRPDLTVVVVNDDGGGLFTQLEQGAPEHAGVFDRLFGTPHRVDLAALCAATGTAYRLAETIGELCEALRQEVPGLRVVEVPVARTRTRELHRRLRAAVRVAVA